MFTWFKNRRRKKILLQPFPPHWREIMNQSITHYSFLDKNERSQLEQLIQLFIAEKKFEGCGGLELTEEVKVVISAQACLLVLGLPPFQYHELESILVYPTTVTLPESRQSIFDSTLTIVPDHQQILGMASMRGPVILVWDAVIHGARHPEHGHNVVYHEFAHILDMRDGTADGTPELFNRKLFQDWVDIFTREFLRLKKEVENGKKSVLDPYGAVHEAEFFAVATELFFDRPLKLQKEIPDLYSVLTAYYRQDTAARERRHRQTAQK
jgi:MtfA peptidase